MPLCRFEVGNLLPFSGTESPCGKHLALYTDGRLRYFTFVTRANLVRVSISCDRSRRSSAEERGICNPQVVGSNPTGGSTLLPPYCQFAAASLLAPRLSIRSGYTQKQAGL